MSVGGGGASYSISDNVHLTGRKLLNPDEVIRLLATTDAARPRQAVHFLRGVAPVQAELTPWFLNETCRQRHGDWQGGNTNGATRPDPT